MHFTEKGCWSPSHSNKKSTVCLEIFSLRIFNKKIKLKNIKHPNFPLLTFEIDSICKGPDPKPAELGGKTLLAHVCLFLTLWLVSLPLTFSSTDNCPVLSAAGGCLASPAQICIEFQVGHWVFKLSYSTAL